RFVHGRAGGLGDRLEAGELDGTLAHGAVLRAAQALPLAGERGVGDAEAGAVPEVLEGGSARGGGRPLEIEQGPAELAIRGGVAVPLPKRRDGSHASSSSSSTCSSRGPCTPIVIWRSMSALRLGPVTSDAYAGGRAAMARSLANATSSVGTTASAVTST